MPVNFGRVFERPSTTNPPRTRLTSLLAERDPAARLAEFDRQHASAAEQNSPPAVRTGRAGHLVERWVAGGGRTIVRLRALGVRWRLPLVTIGALLTGVVGTLALASGTTRVEAPPPLPVAAVTSTTTTVPTAEYLVVSVVGKVRSPGLVTLVPGARVAAALDAAGGVPAGVDITSLNLARKLTDGEQIAVGIPAAPQPEAAASGAAGVPSTVDLNSATVQQLDVLPGVGKVTAQRIVEWRTQHGRFTSITQLRDISGIGEAKFGRLRGLVKVG